MVSGTGHAQRHRVTRRLDRGIALTTTSMAGTCVAVLAGLGLCLLRPRRTAAVVAGPALLKVTWTTRPGRDRDPPCLVALSVRRC